MKFLISSVVGTILTLSVIDLNAAYAQGVWDDLKSWEQAAPTREAEGRAAELRARAARASCKGEKALCETQLVNQGWHVVSSGYEPLGIDIGLSFKLLQIKDQHKICTTFISHNGTGQERPCNEMKAESDSVKN